jgi:hypothetical protein
MRCGLLSGTSVTITYELSKEGCSYNKKISIIQVLGVESCFVGGRDNVHYS